jgi:soluble lytic murein transglycosylase-like protein
MSFAKPLRIALVLLAAQLSASAAEIAVLRNGFSISFVRKQQTGSMTRLFTASGFIDVPTTDIASYEKDETPAPAAIAASPVAPPSGPSMSVPPDALASTSAPASPVAQPAPAVTLADIDQAVREASSRHQLDPDFVNSVIKAESNFHPRAVSNKGAQGLMQLMPQTASKLGVTDPFDPKANIEAGTAHLKALLSMYGNDPVKALAAYNAGAHRVEQYHGVPPYRETRAYVSKIVRDFNAKKRAQMKNDAAKTPAKNATAKTATPNAAQKKTAAPRKQQASVSKSSKPA